MTTREKAISHYGRMIEWAKNQDPMQYAVADRMYHDIHEDWLSDSCEYCKAKVDLDSGCKLGPDGICVGGLKCCGGLWVDMNSEVTWEEWIESAKKVKDYIEENG